MGDSRSIVAAFIHASCSIVLLASGAMAILADGPDTSRHDPSVLLEQGDAFADFDALPVWTGKTSTVHRAVEGEWQYNLHAYLIFHEGRFWAMWSAGYAEASDVPWDVTDYSPDEPWSDWEPLEAGAPN